MLGQARLIEMRLAGHVPDWVFIETEPNGLRLAEEWHTMDNTKAVLQLDVADKRPDLRCVAGLSCYVEGSDIHRVHAVRDACIAANAQRVIAAVLRRVGSGEWVTFNTIETTDTDGVFVYSAAAASEVPNG
jgi:hypothetical protein